MLLENLQKEDWEKYLDENFQVQAVTVIHEPLTFKLTSVSGYGHRQGGNREAYSLLFSGPLNPVLPQQIFRIGHAGLGELEIFLVPIGPQNGSMGYEAVFT